MLIGAPKEIKNHEYRVGLTPASVQELVAQGHQVIVERRNVEVAIRSEYHPGIWARECSGGEHAFEVAGLAIESPDIVRVKPGHVQVS